MVTKREAFKQLKLYRQFREKDVAQNSDSNSAEQLAALTILAEYFIKLDNRRALRFATEARDLAERMADRFGIAASLRLIGMAQFWLSDFVAAEDNLQAALRACQNNGDEIGQARNLGMLGSVFLGRDQYPEALKYYFSAQSKFQKIGDKIGEIKILNNIGIVYLELENFAVALDHYLEALRLAEEPEHAVPADEKTSLVAEILCNLGDAFLRMERWAESLEYYERAQRISRDAEKTYTECVALTSLGEIYIRLKQFDSAKRVLEDGLNLSRKLGDYLIEVKALGYLGQLLTALGDFRSSALRYRDGIKIARRSGMPRSRLAMRLGAAENFIRAGKFRFAERYLKTALEIGVVEGWRTETARSHELFADMYESNGDYRQALIHQKDLQKIKQLLWGEKQDQRIEVLLVQHEIEKTKQIAEAQRILNDQLRSANEELSRAVEANRNLIERIKHQAQHDSLTGLPNRTLFEDRLEQTVRSAHRYDQHFAVMFIDLNGFKRVNDIHGHNAGDELLFKVGQRFSAALRKSDTVARFGGDEFTVILHRGGTLEKAAAAAGNLLAALDDPFDIAGSQITVGASIGISLFPKDGLEAVTLQKHADIAMYAAKRSNRRTWRFYASEMMPDL